MAALSTPLMGLFNYPTKTQKLQQEKALKLELLSS